MISLKRALVVTVGLSAAGALFGALCATIAVFVGSAFYFGISSFPGAASVSLLLRGAALGAIVGTVAAPVFAWVVLRSVPFGRAILFTSVGTIAGSILGNWLAPIRPYGGSSFPGILIGSFIGFVVAGILSRVLWRRSQRSESAEPVA